MTTKSDKNYESGFIKCSDLCEPGMQISAYLIR